MTEIEKELIKRLRDGGCPLLARQGIEIADSAEIRTRPVEQWVDDVFWAIRENPLLSRPF